MGIAQTLSSLLLKPGRRPKSATRPNGYVMGNYEPTGGFNSSVP